MTTRPDRRGKLRFAAIEGTVGWDRFTAAVGDAQVLTARHSDDPVELIQASYVRLRCHTPLLLETVDRSARAPVLQL